MIDRTTAKERRVIHYWFTLAWFTAGTILWVVLKDALWFVGFMSLYAIWWTHIGSLSGETPVEVEGDDVDVEHADNVEQK